MMKQKNVVNYFHPALLFILLFLIVLPFSASAFPAVQGTVNPMLITAITDGGGLFAGGIKKGVLSQAASQAASDSKSGVPSVDLQYPGNQAYVLNQALKNDNKFAQTIINTQIDNTQKNTKLTKNYLTKI